MQLFKGVICQKWPEFDGRWTQYGGDLQQLQPGLRLQGREDTAAWDRREV